MLYTVIREIELPARGEVLSINKSGRGARFNFHNK